MAERGGAQLPAPRVAPGEYDEAYYLHACGGGEEWRTSGGARFAPVYEGALARAALAPGEVVVDIGTGRGELLVVATGAGAARAVGVEYSPAAVELARRTIASHGAGGRAEVLEADARALPVQDASADLVTLLDVAEHLAPAELDATLREALRVLRPGGRVLVHTLPNRLIYSVTYRLQRLASPRRWTTWPRDPRNDYELRMHVNEQTPRSLWRALRGAGFGAVDVRLGDWVYTDHVPRARSRALYHRLAAHRVTAPFGVADIWATATRPAAGAAG